MFYSANGCEMTTEVVIASQIIWKYIYFSIANIKLRNHVQTYSTFVRKTTRTEQQN